MGPYTDTVPKAFIEVAGQTLFDRQRDALGDHVDALTIVIGYQADAVKRRVSDAGLIVFEDWREFENAESLRRALVQIDDDVLVLNGDIVITDAVINRLVDHHASLSEPRSMVGCIPGVQTEDTAIQCDSRGRVTDYGLIPGHRHAGLGILDSSHRETALSYLSRHRTDWYPGVYTAVETEMLPIAADHHIEINRPSDLAVARSKLPLAPRSEQDLQS